MNENKVPPIIFKENIVCVTGEFTISYFPISWLKDEVKLGCLRQEIWFTHDLEIEIEELMKTYDH